MVASRRVHDASARLRLERLDDRTLPAATLDPTFGQGGVVTPLLGVPILASGDLAYTAPLSDGGLVSVVRVVGALSTQLAVFRLTSTGQLDPGFGQGGVALVNASQEGAGNSEMVLAFAPAGVVAAPDGRVLIAGTAFRQGHGTDFEVLRLTPGGQLDPTFDGDGRAFIGFDLGSGQGDQAKALLIAPDGRVLVAGTAQWGSIPLPGSGVPGLVGSEVDVPLNRAAVARLNPDGSLDSSFGIDGRSTVPFTSDPLDNSEARALALDPAGRVVIAGGSGIGAQGGSLQIARLTAAGSLDPSFAKAGIATITLGPAPTFPQPQGVETSAATAGFLVIQPDSRVLVAGTDRRTLDTSQGQRAVVAQLTATGQLDPALDGDGIWAARVGPLSGITGFATGPGNRLILMMEGRMENPVPQPIVRDWTLTAYPGSAGSVIPGANTALLLRLMADGSVDEAFGPGGQYQVPPIPPPEGWFSRPTLVAQQNGALVVAGFTTDSLSQQRVTLLRLAPDPLLASQSTVIPGSVNGSQPPTGGPSAASGLTPPGALSGLPSEHPRPISLTEFIPGFTGPVRIGLVDVTGDGTPDYVIGAGFGGGPRVRVVDGATGTVVVDFFAFDPQFRGGIFVTATDLDGDGKAEVVVTPGTGGGPVVAVFGGAGLAAGLGGASALFIQFWGIEDSQFRGGAQAAFGDLNGDTIPDLIVAAGGGGGSRIAVFNGTTLRGVQEPTKLIGDFFAFDPTGRNGAYVGAGDVDGDGQADLAFGAGPGGAPRVRLFGGAKVLATAGLDGLTALADFFDSDPAQREGVPLGLRDLDGDHRADLLTGSGEGRAPRLHVYFASTLLNNPTPSVDQEFDPLGTSAVEGVFVG